MDRAAIAACVKRMCALYAHQPTKPTPELIDGLISVLAAYPDDVIIAAASPKGVALGCRYLPTIADLSDWCEASMAPAYREAERLKAEGEARRLAADSEIVDPEKRDRAAAIVASALNPKFLAANEVLRSPDWQAGDRLDREGALRWNETNNRPEARNQAEAEARLKTLTSERDKPLPRLNLAALRTLVRQGRGDFEISIEDERRILAEAEAERAAGNRR